MTPRKGNLMGVRTDIKVLDATIRDGGLCNNFDFSDEFVRELYKTNIKSGVDGDHLCGGKSDHGYHLSLSGSSRKTGR